MRVNNVEQILNGAANHVYCQPSTGNSYNVSFTSTQTASEVRILVYYYEAGDTLKLGVVFQLMGVGILLTLISSLFAIIFVLRYDPLKIMSNRD